MSADAGSVEVEATAETLGEAKWQALRELERRHPGLDRDRVTFEVISEGTRGLLGVGTTPACVRARAELTGDEAPAGEGETALAALVRETLDRIADAVGVSARAVVQEDEHSLHASLAAPAAQAGLLIGRNGRTIDAIQQVVSAIAHRAEPEGRRVEVDAGGYRARRRERLTTMARRAAEQALATGRPCPLEPMTAAERKIVHDAVAALDGVETTSEGDEPDRHVVVVPSSAA